MSIVDLLGYGCKYGKDNSVDLSSTVNLAIYIELTLAVSTVFLTFAILIVM